MVCFFIFCIFAFNNEIDKLIELRIAIYIVMQLKELKYEKHNNS
jgi:hypothetical protein